MISNVYLFHGYYFKSSADIARSNSNVLVASIEVIDIESRTTSLVFAERTLTRTQSLINKHYL